MAKFKDRYVLGEGYPQAICSDYDWAEYTSGVVLTKETDRQSKSIEIKYPKSLDTHAEFPKYKLILERVKGGE